jgi:hypothetical protein
MFLPDVGFSNARYEIVSLRLFAIYLLAMQARQNETIGIFTIAGVSANFYQGILEYQISH